eukprot:Opistho-2@51396
MTSLMLISAGLNAMLGIALLLLWRQDRRFVYVRQWGWSWVLLGLGLTIGPVLFDATAPGPLHDLQSLLASLLLMGSQWLQLDGALRYRERRLPMRPCTLR